MVRFGRGVENRLHPSLSVMHATPVGRTTQPRLELADRGVQGRIEIGSTCLGPHHGTTGFAGYFYVLASAGLASIALMVQFDINSNDFVVDPLDPAEFFRNVHPIVIRHLNVASTHDNVHATSTVCLTRDCPGTYRRPRHTSVSALR